MPIIWTDEKCETGEQMLRRWKRREIRNEIMFIIIAGFCIYGAFCLATEFVSWLR